MSGSGLLALQKALDVGRRSAAAAARQRSPSANSSAMETRLPPACLADIHAGVGDADDVFRRKAVRRETGHAKAAGDVVFAEHGVGREPYAQAFGQRLRLLHAGFRHQDDELVAAVAGHDVGLAAPLFEQPAHARQHQVAFQMAEGVVDFLELVEIDQHDRERASGAGSALPLRRECFPEEAPRLDAGQAVGDGLLLQFLEDERVVQRGGQQVGQRAHDQHILRGEGVLPRGSRH